MEQGGRGAWNLALLSRLSHWTTHHPSRGQGLCLAQRQFSVCWGYRPVCLPQGSAWLSQGIHALEGSVAILSLPPALHPAQGSPRPQSTPALQSLSSVCGPPLHVPPLYCHYRCVCSHSDRKWIPLLLVPPEPCLVPSLPSVIEYPLVT